MFFDALRVKIRDEVWSRTRQFTSRTPLIQHDEKDVLGLWIEQSEGGQVLAQGDERAQGPRRHLLIAVVDGLNGLPEAVNSATARRAGDAFFDERQGCANALKVLSDSVPRNIIVVLGPTDDVELARIAIRNGARGYIPCTMEFEIAVRCCELSWRVELLPAVRIRAYPAAYRPDR